jgi:uncharacterized protein YcbX
VVPDTGSPPHPFVSALAITAVKGTRIRTVDRIELGTLGAAGDRAFYVIDARGRMVNGKQLGALQAVVADYDPEAGRLGLSFPDGESVEAPLRYGDALATSFFSRERQTRPLDGPWAAALSEFVGQPVRLVEPDIAVDRGRRGSVSVISRASLQRLAEVAGEDTVDPRRFRMLIEVGGVPAHAEDAWLGRCVRLGPALVAMNGNVGRCMVTSRNPETGEIDLPTLDTLGRYRRELATTEPLAFGIYGEVLEPGPVAVGDPVSLEAG